MFLSRHFIKVNIVEEQLEFMAILAHDLWSCIEKQSLLILNVSKFVTLQFK